MVNHHPSPELLADYSSGSMRLSHAICVSAHLEYCSECRDKVTKMASIGSYYLESVSDEKHTDDAIDEDTQAIKKSVFSLLDKEDVSLDEAEKVTGSLRAKSSDNFNSASALPTSLKQFFDRDSKGIEWSAITPSIKLATMCHDKDGSQIALSCVKAGGKLPHHRHSGEELTVVLDGSFSDETGVFCKGDFIARDVSHKHKPVVTNDAPCVCLMVLDAPIEFTGFFARWLNPFVRRHHAHS